MADQKEFRILCSVPTEAEATIIVASLEDAGIDAWTEGGLSAGFRAEAPGNANVLVPEADYERAAEVVGTKHDVVPASDATPSVSSKPLLIMVIVLAIALALLAVLGFLG